MSYDRSLVSRISDTLIRASSTLTAGHKKAFELAIKNETNANSKWAMELILQSALLAEEQNSPLCDDTGIPHVVLDVGSNASITLDLLNSIDEGIRQGLSALPGRPMAVKGDLSQRIDQSLGLDNDPDAVEPAPVLLRKAESAETRLHILMFGGGPAIRGKTYRVFHKHSVDTVIDEIIAWATEGTSMLGCTPSTLAVGIGRSQYEASSLMLQALVDGNHLIQNDMERRITQSVNESRTGSLGLGGKTTVLATFLKVGPQRASGVRVVSIRPCCCYEPRIASLSL